MDPLVAFMSALAFVAAYFHVRAARRRRPGGWVARLILAGGACLWLLYGSYELSVEREFKAEDVPIRVDLVFIRPALVVLLILGVLAYLIGLAGPKLGATPKTASISESETAPGPGDTRTLEQANERLPHSLTKESENSGTGGARG